MGKEKMNVKCKKLEFPVKLSFMYYKEKPPKEIEVNYTLITGKGKYFYIILDKNDSLLNNFKTADEVYAFYDSSATFKYLKMDVGDYCYFIKFEIVYNKFAKKGLK